MFALYVEIRKYGYTKHLIIICYKHSENKVLNLLEI